MKTKVIEITVVERNYPYLGISKTNNAIVLFTSESCGTVLSVSNTSCSYGWYSVAWNEDCFDLFKGKVELSN
jgi:hypothetical protein